MTDQKQAENEKLRIDEQDYNKLLADMKQVDAYCKKADARNRELEKQIDEQDEKIAQMKRTISSLSVIAVQYLRSLGVDIEYNDY